MFKPPLPALFTAARGLIQLNDAKAQAKARTQPATAHTLSAKSGEGAPPGDARGRHKPDGKARTAGPRAKTHNAFAAMSRSSEAREAAFDSHGFMARYAQPSEEALGVYHRAHESVRTLEAQVEQIRAQAVAQAEERAKLHHAAASQPEEAVPAELAADAPEASTTAELGAGAEARSQAVPDLHDMMSELEAPSDSPSGAHDFAAELDGHPLSRLHKAQADSTPDSEQNPFGEACSSLMKGAI